MEKILNKRKIRGVEKYLVRWKGFMAESDTWEKREDLENAREALEEFGKRMDAEVRKQERIDMAEEKDFRRGELPGKYMAKLIYGQNDKKFKEEYLAKLEKNWKKQKEDRQIDENKYFRKRKRRKCMKGTGEQDIFPEKKS